MKMKWTLYMNEDPDLDVTRDKAWHRGAIVVVHIWISAVDPLPTQ